MVTPPIARVTQTLGTVEKMSTAQTANVLLLDQSDSTSQAIGRGDARPKLVGIQEAVTIFISSLPTSAHLSIIAFHSKAEVLWPMQAIGHSKLDIIKRVQEMISHGTTDMAGSLLLAEQEFSKVGSGFILRAYNLSDGIPNEDPSAQAERLRNSGVQLHCIGFGDPNCQEIDEMLLRNMASQSASGTILYYHFVEARQLTGFLKRESKTLTQ